MFRRGLSAAKFADLSINSCDDFEVAVGALVPTACCLLLERAACAAFSVCVPRSLDWGSLQPMQHSLPCCCTQDLDEQGSEALQKAIQLLEQEFFEHAAQEPGASR